MSHEWRRAARASRGSGRRAGAPCSVRAVLSRCSVSACGLGARRAAATSTVPSISRWRRRRCCRGSDRSSGRTPGARDQAQRRAPRRPVHARGAGRSSAPGSHRDGGRSPRCPCAGANTAAPVLGSRCPAITAGPRPAGPPAGHVEALRHLERAVRIQAETDQRRVDAGRGDLDPQRASGTPDDLRLGVAVAVIRGRSSVGSGASDRSSLSAPQPVSVRAIAKANARLCMGTPRVSQTGRPSFAARRGSQKNGAMSTILAPRGARDRGRVTAQRRSARHGAGRAGAGVAADLRCVAQDDDLPHGRGRRPPGARMHRVARGGGEHAVLERRGRRRLATRAATEGRRRRRRAVPGCRIAPGDCTQHVTGPGTISGTRRRARRPRRRTSWPAGP